MSLFETFCLQAWRENGIYRRSSKRGKLFGLLVIIKMSTIWMEYKFESSTSTSRTSRCYHKAWRLNLFTGINCRTHYIALSITVQMSCGDEIKYGRVYNSMHDMPGTLHTERKMLNDDAFCSLTSQGSWSEEEARESMLCPDCVGHVTTCYEHLF